MYDGGAGLQAASGFPRDEEFVAAGPCRAHGFDHAQSPLPGGSVSFGTGARPPGGVGSH